MLGGGSSAGGDTRILSGPPAGYISPVYPAVVSGPNKGLPMPARISSDVIGAPRVAVPRPAVVGALANEDFIGSTTLGPAGVLTVFGGLAPYFTAIWFARSASVAERGEPTGALVIPALTMLAVTGVPALIRPWSPALYVGLEPAAAKDGKAETFFGPAGVLTVFIVPVFSAAAEAGVTMVPALGAETTCGFGAGVDGREATTA